MRELSNKEINAVSGGARIVGLRLALGPSSAPGLLAMSFYAGYKVGTFIYDTYTSIRY